MNGHDWWKRETTQGLTDVMVYYSDTDSRWTIEAPDVTWFAASDPFITSDDDRRPPGIEMYFGGPPSSFEQISANKGSNGRVHVSLTCFDTGFPTQQPTDQPTDQPTVTSR